MRHSATFLQEILRLAIEAIKCGRYEHVYRRDFFTGQTVIWHFANNLSRLNACCLSGELYDEDDCMAVICECLENAQLSPFGTYKRPENNVCSHQEALGLEMFAFVVSHEDFSLPIYTKFCLKEQINGTWYVCIDCHPST